MIPCTNPFHEGPRPDAHAGSLSCDPRVTKSGEWYCANRCHTHPERVPDELDYEACIRLFEALIGKSAHLKPLSDMERREVARYYLGIEGDLFDELMQRKLSRPGYASPKAS